MIDESQNLKQFLRELVKRSDGWILIAGTIACGLLFLWNLYGQTEAENRWFDKWLMLWALFPLILLFLHIRLRQLLDRETLLATFCHAVVILTAVGFLAIKNMRLI